MDSTLTLAARDGLEDRFGVFAGDDPLVIAQRWLTEAEATEPNDPNAIALSTVDASGMPNARMVLLKGIEAGPRGAFVFFTNYESVKAREIDGAGAAAFVVHWKSLRRQIRVRGPVVRDTVASADAYFASRSARSRLGAWAPQQSRPLGSRQELMDSLAEVTARLGDDPPRPEHWGGYRIVPLEVEFWADGESRLHDRFQWTRPDAGDDWTVSRLSP